MSKDRNKPHKKSTVQSKPYFGIPPREVAELATENKRMKLRFDKQLAQFSSMLLKAQEINAFYLKIAQDLSITDDTYLSEKSKLVALLKPGMENIHGSLGIIIKAKELLEDGKTTFTDITDTVSASFNLVEIQAELNTLLETELTGRYQEIMLGSAEYFKRYLEKDGGTSEQQ